MALIAVGIDHEHASLDFLERATVVEADWSKVLRTLVSRRNIHEAVFVSTCLRTEVIAVIDRFHGAIDEISETLAEVTGLDVAEFENRLSVHFDRGVATHLFSVASGLKSVVPGEFEVLGQLRRALELAQEEQTAGAELDELFHRALSIGRRVRAETTIARGTTSFAQASVSMASEELGDELRDANCVVVGAGQLATGVVKSLLATAQRIGHITVVNRTIDRAKSLVDEIGDERLTVGELSEVGTLLRGVRLAVIAIEATTPVVTRAHLEQCEHPLFILDLGIPRAVEHAVADLGLIRRVDVDDLRARIEHVLEERHEAIDAARELVEAEVEKFLSDQRARGAATIVRELREHFDGVINAELARREHDLDGLSDEQREVVHSLVRSVVAKIAHRPTVALKEAAGTDQGVRLSEATRNLFDL